MVLQWVKTKATGWRGRGGGAKQANSLINTWEPAEPIYLRLALALSFYHTLTHTLRLSHARTHTHTLPLSIFNSSNTHALCLSCSSLEKFLYKIFCTVCSTHFSLSSPALSLSEPHTHTPNLSLSRTHPTLFVSVRWLGADVYVIFSFSFFSFYFLLFRRVSLFGLGGGGGGSPPPLCPPPFSQESIKMKRRRKSSISILNLWPKSKVHKPTFQRVFFC